MHIAFVKHSLAWPRVSGHDVHCYYMMRALGKRGHRVSLATVVAPVEQATSGLDLVARSVLDAVPGENQSTTMRLSYMQERFRSYWGVDQAHIAAVGRFTQQVAADVLVVAGLEALPYLAGSENCGRVWYAADEWAWHHLSLLKIGRQGGAAHLHSALVKGFYERCFRKSMDRVWVVSEADRRAMRWVAGVKAVDVVPNGVDADYYCPMNVPEESFSCVFWGRLDFEPNIDALNWFCAQVWPDLKARQPGAVFRIFGFNPVPSIMQLTGYPGVEVHPNLSDLRAGVCRNAVAVFPFTSGWGIKNKLLEAAALGKACVCTPRACNGLRGTDPFPFVVGEKSEYWKKAILDLWNNQEQRRRLGGSARQWVIAHHSWDSAADAALTGLSKSLTVVSPST